MEKFFNTAGPNKPDIHYEIAPLSRFDLDEVLMLIRQQKYFVLHAPRQTGKTTCMLALRNYLNEQGDYMAVYANVEGGQAARENVQSVVAGICDTIARQTASIFEDERVKSVRDNVRDNDSSSMLSSFLAQLSRVLPEQTAEYMDLVGAVDEGHLIIFDRTQEKTWEERIWHMPRNCAGRTIMVWGM